MRAETMTSSSNSGAAVPVITVDGPSGVGKGTVSRGLAARLGWQRLDSGALYRILALSAVDAGIALSDTDAVAALASGLDIRFTGDHEDNEAIWVNGRDIKSAVRAESTGGLASQIAAAPAVRAALLQRQKDFRVAPGLIGDGRDMGTVVFPDARLKLFLTASAEERAQRRLRQLRAAGQDAILADLCTEISTRDERDRTRTVAPLVPASDAILIDTTHLNPTQVAERVEGLVKDRGFL